MSRIKGDEKTIKRILDTKPGDPMVYVNLDAIEQLPDEYEAVAVKVTFDKEKDFTNIGTELKPSYYPITKLMYDIAEKRGISGVGDIDVQPLYEDVNISDMNMEKTAVLQKMKVGYKVIKQGSVLQEDGTSRLSGPRIGIFNAWDECQKLWVNEEKWTEGYSKKAKYDNKYDTKWKRKAHFQDLLDKAVGMADTTSWLKCIRECAGLKTGFNSDELAEGAFYFTKIVRSEKAIKAETAAKLLAISHGHYQSKPLYPMAVPLPEVQEIIPVKIEPVEREKDPREQMISIFCHYIDNDMIPDSQKASIDRLFKWVKTTPECANDEKLWPKALNCLRQLEETIPEVGRFKHDLY